MRARHLGLAVSEQLHPAFACLEPLTVRQRSQEEAHGCTETVGEWRS